VDQVAVEDVALAGDADADGVAAEGVGGQVVALAPVDLQAVGVVFEAVAHHAVVVAQQDLDALGGFRVGRGGAEQVVGHQVEGRATGQLQAIAVVDQLVAQDLVVVRGGGGRVAGAVVAGQHDAGAALVGDDRLSSMTL
jgi:hypothetical protein